MKTVTKHPGFFKTVAFLIALSIIVPAVPISAHAAPGTDGVGVFSEMRQGFRELRESVEGIGRFIKTLHSIIDAITTIIDPAAIVLLLVVLFFSSGYAAIGIPRGRASFAASLVTVDLLWYIWKRSMNPGSLSFVCGMIITNLYILAPYLAAVVLRKLLGQKFSEAHSSLTGFIRRKVLRKSIDRKEILLITDTLKGDSISLASSIERDVGVEGAVTGVSPASRELLRRLEDTIQKIKSF